MDLRDHPAADERKGKEAGNGKDMTEGNTPPNKFLVAILDACVGICASAELLAKNVLFSVSSVCLFVCVRVSVCLSVRAKLKNN